MKPKLLLAGLFLGIFLAGLPGCTTTPIYTHGVPHLLKVEGVPNAYRSGQPSNEEAVRYLVQDLGVQRVYKLDNWNEGDSDKYFAKYGAEVIYLPIPPTTKPGSFNDYADIIAGPNAAQLDSLVTAVRWIWAHPEVVVLWHCVNGNDRTGAMSGWVVLKSMTVDQAWKYMLATGYHWELVGLTHGWWERARDLKNETTKGN